MKIKCSFFLILLSVIFFSCSNQENDNQEIINLESDRDAHSLKDNEEDLYVAPEEENILERIREWQDLKFGLIVHWGIYSVPGIVESWSICSEDEDWIPRDSTIRYDDYKRQYFNYSEVFEPNDFNAKDWAEMAADAGMKYLVFTTKHHDGFCMFDSKYSDYGITKGPFKDNPKANITKFVFEAFRDKGIKIGAYFSKPDWHSQDYWWDKYATADRNVNYTIDKHPHRWEDFKTFVYNQIEEIVSEYGEIDILWLDGGWVDAKNNQDIDMPKIAEMVRAHQKDMMIVDRTIHGKYENYLTPEQAVPSKQMSCPWETCMTLGKDWGYVPNEDFKSTNTVISNLVEVVAKGGNLLLGVGPDSKGVFPEEAKQRLSEIGEWLSINGLAIYNTISLEHYQDKNIWFVQNKEKDNIYAIYCKPEGETFPEYIEWENNTPKEASEILCLSTKENVRWEKISSSKTRIYLSEDLIKKSKNLPLAFSFKID